MKLTPIIACGIGLVPALLWASLLICLPYQGGAILGGKKAPEGSYTFAVALRRNGIYYCSGSIVSKNQIVTAAHCVIRADDPTFQETPLQVLIGSNNYKNPEVGLVIDVQNVFVPKSYSAESKDLAKIGDIAVLELHGRLKLDIHNLQLSKLFLPERRSYDVKGGTLVGFGWDTINRQADSSGTAPLGKLKSARIIILPNSECQKYYGDTVDDGEHFCGQARVSSGNSPVGACIGDNGGPLVHDKDTLTGVLINYSVNCNDNEKPQLYIKVLKYKAFIKKASRSQFDAEFLGNKLTIIV